MRCRRVEKKKIGDGIGDGVGEGSGLLFRKRLIGVGVGVAWQEARGLSCVLSQYKCL